MIYVEKLCKTNCFLLIKLPKFDEVCIYYSR